MYQLGGNTLYLRGDWAAMFDKHSWTLVPDEKILLEIIRKLINLKKHRKNVAAYEVINKGTYTYNFVAFDLEGIPITRLPDDSGFPSPERCITYLPPYNSFPTLLLPLHPYLAIHRAIKAFDLYNPVTDEHIQMHNHLRRIRDLWLELAEYTDSQRSSVMVPRSSPGAKRKSSPPESMPKRARRA
ncbi:hypothetical protein K474DRAFT_949631 [Panus rudis PR-1116 ss-1]|nr:hypothetical protein K474DRAFT_949631 [Panus rudis PR-1116 ss-1]